MTVYIEGVGGGGHCMTREQVEGEGEKEGERERRERVCVRW